MKKDRNAFFNENNMANYNYNPNMPMMNTPAMYPPSPMPINQGGMNSYAPINQMGMVPNISDADYESRINKLERQVNRLENRVSKLETDINPITYNKEQTSSNLYMV